MPACRPPVIAFAYDQSHRATIIRGTSLFGGKGRIWGTLVGVLFLGCIANGMTLLNVSEYWQYVARGAIILGAVLLNQVLERWR
jgi:sugar transport system permease protein